MQTTECKEPHHFDSSDTAALLEKDEWREADPLEQRERRYSALQAIFRGSRKPEFLLSLCLGLLCLLVLENIALLCLWILSAKGLEPLGDLTGFAPRSESFSA